MTSEEELADLRLRLAEADERNAALTRMLERQGYQLDRMQDQLERALKELTGLRRLLNRPPPDEPSPTPPPAPPPTEGGVPEPPATPPRSKPPPGKKGRFGRNQLPKNLARVRDAQPVDACPGCGGTDAKVLRDETVEVYDYLPARVVVRMVVRPVCRCSACQHIATAPFPATLVPRLRATPRLIAHMIFEKWSRHLSLHRVDKELSRLGAEIPETTRDGWFVWSAAQLLALLPALKRALFAEGLVHTDGTGLDVIEPKMGTRLGQIAVFCNAVATIYAFTSTKHGVHQRRFLGLEGPDGKPPPSSVPRFAGWLVADAASIADRTYADGSIVECGCNAHARRKFEENEETDRRIVGEALAFWSALYAVEAKAARLTPSDRLALRQERSAPIVADLRRWLDAQLGTRLPQDPITKALNYTHNHWAALTRFLEDGRVPIDNNPAERALRGVAVGRKNYLFAGSDAAAERSGILYTFVMTCAQHDVDPNEWLTDVLPRIADTPVSALDQLLPHRWKKTIAAEQAA